VKQIAHLRKILLKETIRKAINDDEDLKNIIKPMPIPEMEP
jgi:hypothetical protein